MGEPHIPEGPIRIYLSALQSPEGIIPWHIPEYEAFGPREILDDFMKDGLIMLAPDDIFFLTGSVNICLILLVYRGGIVNIFIQPISKYVFIIGKPVGCGSAVVPFVTLLGTLSTWMRERMKARMKA